VKWVLTFFGADQIPPCFLCVRKSAVTWRPLLPTPPHPSLTGVGVPHFDVVGAVDAMGMARWSPFITLWRRRMHRTHCCHGDGAAAFCRHHTLIRVDQLLPPVLLLLVIQPKVASRNAAFVSACCARRPVSVGELTGARAFRPASVRSHLDLVMPKSTKNHSLDIWSCGAARRPKPNRLFSHPAFSEAFIWSCAQMNKELSSFL